MAAALLLVDVQRDFFARSGLVPPRDILVARLSALLQQTRNKGLPVIHVRTRIRPDGVDSMPHWRRRDTRACVEGTPGYAPPISLQMLTGELLFHKQFFSAFGNVELHPTLERLGIADLIVAGLYTHGCIRATVMDAYERGFRVWVVDDAIGSTEPIHAEISRDWLRRRAACFLPSAEILAHLDSTARSDPRRDTDRLELDRRPSVEASPLRLGPPQPSSIAAACFRAADAGRRWSRRKPSEQAAVLALWADSLERDGGVLTELLAREIGKPSTEASDELRRTLTHIRFAARICCEPAETTSAPGVQVRYRPVGTVALITPWNNPLAIPAGKIAPALAFGNGCVWKPSPLAPGCTARLYQALREAGLPEGVVEVVSGDADAARDIVSDPHIDAVSVTGSNAAGQAIAALCAVQQKALQAELGGNNAALILNDWSFDENDLSKLAQGVFGYSGQRCTAIRRLIVQRGILERFTHAFAAKMLTLRVGDPRDPLTQIGPLISVEHRARVQARLDAAIQDGATIIAQTPLPHNLPPDLHPGCWLAPTLLGGVDPASPIAQEETFGPVALILPADDIDQAVDLANAVPHGLVSALCSNDASARTRFAQEIQTGILKLSPGPPAISGEAPFCGWKSSAIGPPEHGIWDRHFYTRAQVVYQ